MILLFGLILKSAVELHLVAVGMGERAIRGDLPSSGGKAGTGNCLALPTAAQLTPTTSAAFRSNPLSLPPLRFNRAFQRALPPAFHICAARNIKSRRDLITSV
jgi:hypothetical protein